MSFNQTQFQKFILGLGLSPQISHGKIVQLFQDISDIVIFQDDAIEIRGAEIKDTHLVSKQDRLNFQELEILVGLSQRIRYAGFPKLELKISIDRKITGVEAREISTIPSLRPSTQLIGIPASPGRATGEALVLPQDEDISGKILVLQNSRDLITLLKKRPLAVILEEGNLLSHASILAREAKIPAIVRVPHATQKIITGVQLEVDASKGTVKIS